MMTNNKKTQQSLPAPRRVSGLLGANSPKKEMRSLAKSLSFAFRGIGYCLRNERNMRIHMMAAVYALMTAVIMQVSNGEFAMVIVSITLVMFAEMINTAIEAIVAMGTTSYDQLAKVAKDITAGAVLLCAFFSLGVGCMVFVRVERVTLLLQFFAQNIWAIVLLVLLTFVFGVFIFMGPDRIAKLFIRKKR